MRRFAQLLVSVPHPRGHEHSKSRGDRVLEKEGTGVDVFAHESSRVDGRRELGVGERGIRSATRDTQPVGRVLAHDRKRELAPSDTARGLCPLQGERRSRSEKNATGGPSASVCKIGEDARGDEEIVFRAARLLLVEQADDGKHFHHVGGAPHRRQETERAQRRAAVALTSNGHGHGVPGVVQRNVADGTIRHSRQTVQFMLIFFSGADNAEFAESISSRPLLIIGAELGTINLAPAEQP